MTTYHLTQANSASTLSIFFSDPKVDTSSGKMTVDMAITGGSPTFDGSVQLMCYDETKTTPIADGLKIIGNPVSTLTLSLDSGEGKWPTSGYTITAEWRDERRTKQTHTLSTTAKSISIAVASATQTVEDVSLVFNFQGVKSGDPKIKVIRPTS